MNQKLYKRILSYIGCLLGVLLIIFAGSCIGSLLTDTPHDIIKAINPKLINDAWVTAEEYIYFIGLWIAALVYLRHSKKNRPIIQVIGTKPKGNTYRNFLIGLLLGFCLNGICVFIAWMHHDIQLEYIDFRPVSFVIIFVCVLVQSSAEEFLCRGYLYQKGIQYFRSPIVAILVNSIYFGVGHIFNDGVTILSIINIIICGVMFSLMVYYFDSIWCAFGVHTAWNFTQNILFGLPNSGSVVPYSVFKLDTNTARNSFAYDVNFGIEGTLVADIVICIFCIVIIVWGRKHRTRPYDVWNADMN